MIAQAPRCTAEEVNLAARSAPGAFPGGAGTPAMKRVHVLYRFRNLIEKRLEEFTLSVCTENGRL